MSVWLQNIWLFLDMLVHLSESLFQNVGNRALNWDSIFFHLVHFVLDVHQLLLNRPFLLIQLNIVFQSIIVCVTVGLLDGDEWALILFGGARVHFLEAVHDTHGAVSLWSDVVVVLIFAAIVVDASTEVFGSLLSFNTFVVPEELGVRLVTWDVFFFDLCLTLVEAGPTIVAEVLLIVDTVPLDLLALAQAAQLNTVVESQWLYFDLSDYLVDQLHTLVVVDAIVMAENAWVFGSLRLNVNRVVTFRASRRFL